MQAPMIEFWYDFASTYSYLSAMRIEQLAEGHGVTVDWKPFLLGPIFQSQGWSTSPFNLYPAKGRYMWRDMERLAAERGLAFRMPEPFPQNSLSASRVALVAADAGWLAPFTRAIFVRQFADGADIGASATIDAVIEELRPVHRLESAQIVARSVATSCKDRLRAQSAEAARLGLFGAPTFRTADGELFWGDDRLDQAVAWARRLKTAVY